MKTQIKTVHFQLPGSYSGALQDTSWFIGSYLLNALNAKKKKKPKNKQLLLIHLPNNTGVQNKCLIMTKSLSLFY